MKILVVDDEEFLRMILTDLLVELGHGVIQASNGIEALKIYRDKKDEIDLVILDILMPFMDGIEVLKEIRKINEGVKVVLTSGIFSERKIEDLISGEKNVEYIQKPYNLAEIERVIRNLSGLV